MEKKIKKEFRRAVKNILGENSSKAAEVQAKNLQAPCQNHTSSSNSIESPLPSLQSNQFEDLNTSVSAKSESNCNQDNYTRQESDVGSSTSDQSNVYEPFVDLSMNLYSALEKEYLSDVTIKCGTVDIKAHKIILCARSPVFEAMFTNPMQESENGVLIVEDIEADVFRDFLDFVYSGQLNDLNVTKACDLLYAAEKYQIRTLKQLCVIYLQSNLSVENAFQILECANFYDTELRSHTLKYISGQFSVIETTEEWKTVQTKNPTLALEVYSSVVKSLQGKS